MYLCLFHLQCLVLRHLSMYRDAWHCLWHKAKQRSINNDTKNVRFDKIISIFIRISIRCWCYQPLFFICSVEFDRSIPTYIFLLTVCQVVAVILLLHKLLLYVFIVLFCVNFFPVAICASYGWYFDKEIWRRNTCSMFVYVLWSKEQRRLNAHRRECIHIFNWELVKTVSQYPLMVSLALANEIAWATLLVFQWIGDWNRNWNENICKEIWKKWFVFTYLLWPAMQNEESKKSGLPTNPWNHMGKHQNIQCINIYSGICTTNTLQHTCHLLTFYDQVSIQSTSVAHKTRTYVNFHSTQSQRIHPRVVVWLDGWLELYSRFELSVYKAILP